MQTTPLPPTPDLLHQNLGGGAQQASLTQWTWVWVDSGSWWWTGRPGVLRFMGSQRDTTKRLSDWTELNWTSNSRHARIWKPLISYRQLLKSPDKLSQPESLNFSGRLLKFYFFFNWLREQWTWNPVLILSASDAEERTPDWNPTSIISILKARLWIVIHVSPASHVLSDRL